MQGPWTHMVLAGIHRGTVPWESGLAVFYKVIPAIPFLDTYPREMDTWVHTKTCVRMFMEA